MQGIKLYIGALECSNAVRSLSYQVQEETGYIYYLNIDLVFSDDLYRLVRRQNTPAAIEVDGLFRCFLLRNFVWRQANNTLSISL